MPPPIGPMTEKQKRLERARRSAKDVELPLQRYFRDLLKIPPHKITPELFADVQSSADDLAEALRRSAQHLYDLIEAVGDESSIDELIAVHRERDERIARKIAASTARWEAKKAANSR